MAIATGKFRTFFSVGSFLSLGFFRKLIAWVRIEADTRRTVRELSRLTHRELADIGIARGNIGEVAAEMSARAHRRA